VTNLNVGDRVRVLYAGPHSRLVGRGGTIVAVEAPPAKYDYFVKVDDGRGKDGGLFYFYEVDLKFLPKGGA
jgi:hypothetical protein